MRAYWLGLIPLACWWRAANDTNLTRRFWRQTRHRRNPWDS